MKQMFGCGSRGCTGLPGWEDERQRVQAGKEGPLPPTLYLGLDGTGIPMRAEELQGRAAKHADGSAQTREVKICAIWSAESRDTDRSSRSSPNGWGARPRAGALSKWRAPW